MMNHRLLFRAGTLAATLGISACFFGPKKIHLDASPDIPAAEAIAKISSTDNGNTKIELAVEHLALPSRVDPSATVYVVWVRDTGAGSRSQNLGALRVDSDLKGNFTGVTPLRTFELFITAERTQTTTDPSGRRLLYTNVGNR
jgi:hypothetical protein